MYLLETKILHNEAAYSLLDSGGGMKLERFGAYILARPDPQALWGKRDASLWVKADASYTRDTETGRGGVWRVSPKMPQSWEMLHGGLTFSIKPTSFKHVGLFPEQKVHWEYIEKTIQQEKIRINNGAVEKIRVLNLFAYTGGASLVAARSGALVTHVDASRSAIEWAKENARLSSLGDASIRWVTEDVQLFVKRELKRGNRYDCIIMDPPAFGHGPKGEVWKIEESLPELIMSCAALLSEQPLFFLMSGYAAGYSPLSFANNLLGIASAHGGSISCGELAIAENDSERLLQAGMYALWGR